jgi:hypothetical protein
MSWTKAFKLSLGCIVALAASFSYSETISDTTQIKSYYDHFISISCDATAERCLAVGVESTDNTLTHFVYKTEDAGLTWSQPLMLKHKVYPALGNDGPATEETFSEYFFKNAEKKMAIQCDDTGLNCLITGLELSNKKRNMIVYTTDDGGLNWYDSQLLPIPEDGRSANLACGKSGRSCLRLHYPYAYTSEDRGQTWSDPVLLPKPERGYRTYYVDDISCSDSGLVCSVVGVSSGGPSPLLTYITQDGGLTWSEPNPLDAQEDKSGAGFFSNIHCDRSGLNCMALRYRLLKLKTFIDVYTTSDSGLTWKKTSELDNTDGELYEPFGLLNCDKTGKTCVAVHSPGNSEGSEPKAFITHDRGQTWTNRVLETPEASSFLSDIFCNDTGVLCQAVGMKGSA